MFKGVFSYCRKNDLNMQAISLAVYGMLYSMALNGADTTLDNPTLHLAFVGLKFLTLLFAIFFSLGKSKNYSDKNIILFTSFFIFMLFNYKTFDIVSSIAFLFFCFSSDNTKVGCFKIFRIYLIFTGVLGVIAYISFVLGLPIPNRIVPYYGEHMTNYLYVDYRFAYLVLEDFIPRQCGLFNEPGFYGTMAALCLIGDKMDFKKNGNILLLIAGTFTLSMAFFVLLSAYVLVTNFKHPFRIIGVALSFAILIFVLCRMGIISDEIISSFIDRFAFEDGEFTGNNRSTDKLDYFVESLTSSTDLFLFGYGPDLDYDFGAVSSYKVYLVRYGYLRCFIIWGLLLFAVVHKTKFNIDKFLLVALFAISLYQRPHIFELSYFIILIGGLLYLDSITQKKNNIYVTKKGSHFSARRSGWC